MSTRNVLPVRRGWLLRILVVSMAASGCGPKRPFGQTITLTPSSPPKSTPTPSPALAKTQSPLTDRYQAWSTNFGEVHDLAASGIAPYQNSAEIDTTNVNSGGKAVKVFGTDLDQVVDLGALADHGVADGPAIDRRPGADLHLVLHDDAAHLRHLAVAIWPHHKAESVLPDTATRMDDHAVANEGMDDRGVRSDRAIAADSNIGTDNRSCADDRARSDLGPRSDHRARVDRDAALHARRRMNERARRRARCLEQRGGP